MLPARGGLRARHRTDFTGWMKMSSSSHPLHSTVSIPRRVFFFWEGGDLPQPYRRNVRYFQEVNPDYDVEVIDSTAALEVVRELSPELFEIFEAIRIPAVRSDIIRMAVLYKHGGWYVDCDTSPRVSLDYWSRSGAKLVLFKVLAANKVAIQNSIMGGTAGHPFFKRSIEIMGRVVGSRSWHYNVYKSTGPAIVMQAASVFAGDPSTLLEEMDYSLVDVISGGTKGSWTYQERCGIWSNEQHPLEFNPNTAVERLESLEAFEYFKKSFEDFPATKAENYRKLLLRCGVQYVRRHGIGKEIAGLSRQYVPAEEVDYHRSLASMMRKKRLEKGLVALDRRFSNRLHMVSTAKWLYRSSQTVSGLITGRFRGKPGRNNED